MRILRIAGRNLASLAGDFEVDFQTGPLAGAGLFAISGPTGAGKSTLLDALCLALYDATPRLLKSNAGAKVPDVGDETVSIQDPRTLLRRGAAEGFAEVDFEASGGQRLRSRWSVRRARNKAGGSLQRADMSLHTLPDLAPLGRTNKEVLAEIALRVGLNFDQFTRSVLLAQNEFSAFLKSDENDRGELLETLTGSTVYSKLSQRAYQRGKDEQERLKLLVARLADQVPMAAEERAALEAASAAANTALAALEPKKAALEQLLRWFEDEQRLRAGVSAAGAALAAAQQTAAAAQPRRAHVHAIDGVQTARPLLTEAQRLAKAQAALQAALPPAQETASARARAATDAKAQCEHAASALAEASQALQAAQPALDQAKAHDARLAALADPYSAASQRRDALAAELAQATAGLDPSGPLTLEHARQLDEAAALRRDAAQTARDNTLQALQAHDIATLQADRAALDVRTRALQATQACWQAWQSADAAHAAAIQASQQARQQCDLQQQEWAAACATLPALQAGAAQAQRSLSFARLACAENVERLRSQLEAHQPCPVCGSADHPYAASDPTLHALLDQLQADAALADSRFDAARSSAAALQERAAAAQERANAAAAELARCANVLGTAESAWMADPGYRPDAAAPAFAAAAQALAAETTALALRETALSEALARRDAAQRTLDLESAAHAAASQTVAAIMARDRLRISLQAASQELAELDATLAALRAQRAALFQGRAVAEVERDFAHQLQAAGQRHTSLQAAANVAAEAAALAAAALQQAHAALAANATALQAAEDALTQWLAAHPGSSAEHLTALLAHDPEWVRAERTALAAIDQACASAQAVLTERSAQHQRHLDAAPPHADSDESANRAALAALLAERDSALAHAARLRSALDQDDARRSSAQALQAELERQQLEERRWARMSELIGSADGKKFRNYAQQFTLDVLLGYANAHLQQLARRYRLERIVSTSGPSLGLMVRDQDMGGEIRSVNSLSGGESFLVSLALALGLASLSSNRIKVESLFIDEGFGSLDSETLRVALDALDGLQASGRRVGVISHVQEMTERIAVRILVQPTGSGSSSVSVA